MASTQTQILTPTDLVFSPLFDKLAQDNLFPDTALQSFLSSPTSPPKAPVSAASNAVVSTSGLDLDHVFSKLISDVPQKSLCSSAALPWANNSILNVEMHNLFTPASLLPVATTSSSLVGSVPATNKKMVLPPLKIPQTPLDTQQAARKVEDSQEQASHRKWRTVYVDPRYQGSIFMHVTSKNRSEEPSEEIPDKLYSSLKYEIRQRATGSLCSLNSIQFLLSKIAVVDAQDFSEILKDKKSFLKGVIESSVVRPPTSSQSDKMEGTLKVQFSEVSTKKKNLCFQICYFVPSDLVNPILITRSATFLVYARKPSQGKKRKRAVPSAVVSESQDNASNIVETSSSCATVTDSLDQFVSRLDELVQSTKRFKPTERETAVKLVAQKLLELDPSVLLHLSKNNDKTSVKPKSRK